MDQPSRKEVTINISSSIYINKMSILIILNLGDNVHVIDRKHCHVIYFMN